MHTRFEIASAIFTLFFAVTALGQTATGPQSTARPTPVVLPSAILQPALSDVQSTTEGLNISKWRGPGGMRASAQADVDSIQRDLGNTLPSLLAQADAASGSVPPSFAVYRNVDALYDVLLRISEVANFAAPSDESAAVASSLQKLEAARSGLGDAILHISQSHEERLTVLESEITFARAAPAAQKKETIIDDGPARASTKRVKRKAIHKKPAPKPAAGVPAASSFHN
ncbi:MAG: hypothetical protein WA634_16965 [Silvibacterium sp.]